MKTTTTVKVNPAAVLAIAHGPETYALVLSVAEEAAAVLREASPVRTGAGRASIRTHVESDIDGWVGAASWDEAHYYMGIQNARRHWADRAAAQVRYV